MRIIVFVFLDLECFIFFFQHDRQVDVEGGIFFSQLRVISVFDKPAGILTVKFGIDMVLYKLGIDFFQNEKTSAFIDHRLFITVFVDQ